MAGMYDPFAHRLNIPFEYLMIAIENEFNDECALIDGLMGIYYPGHEDMWVDYDEGLIYA